MTTTLRTVPFTIDADAIAEGLLEMFTDNERVVLRFGMLPAEKMECVKSSLERKFRKHCVDPECKSDEIAWCAARVASCPCAHACSSCLVQPLTGC